MLSPAILTLLLARIRYRDWRFTFAPKGDGFLLQLQWDDQRDVLHGRKWYLSPHATEGEVVQTALLAVLTAVEHEAREAFQYDGQAIYAPHFAPGALVELAREKAHTVQRT